MSPLDAFLAAGRARAAAHRVFVAADAAARELESSSPAALVSALADAWRTRDDASEADASAERALLRAALAYDASIGGGR